MTDLLLKIVSEVAEAEEAVKDGNGMDAVLWHLPSPGSPPAGRGGRSSGRTGGPCGLPCAGWVQGEV